MTKFIKGLELSELFYKDVVKEIIKKEFPKLKYSAGIMGSGSEVLGFDTERSTDHHWGPRIMIFLTKEDYKNRKKISKTLSEKLPSTFLGYSTHFSEPDEIGVQLLKEAKKGQKVNHRVEFFTIDLFFKEYLKVDINKELTVYDWLTFSEQKLRTIQSGKIFSDDLGLKKIQKKFKYYPKDIWLYLITCEWEKISQEEAFMGRCGEVNDELGSSIVASRLIQSIMRLCFLMEKQYIPYSKWFGTAFLKLNSSKKLTPILKKATLAKNWKEREKFLSQSYEYIAEKHNELNITKPLPTKVSSYYGRPFLVIKGEVFASETKKKIQNDLILNIKYDIGSVNQISNSSNLLEDDQLLKKLKILYK